MGQAAARLLPVRRVAYKTKRKLYFLKMLSLPDVAKRLITKIFNQPNVVILTA